MSLIVQKFGGTSVATLSRIQVVAGIIQKTRQAGHDVVVVVSAMAGETDYLVKLAHQCADEPRGREYDALLATGEQRTTALLSLCLCERGIEASSYAGNQLKILTSGHHKKARILHIDSDRLSMDLRVRRVPVIAGFQGVSTGGDITTFGRGGSDITAVALAAALQADECQLYTDVPGVCTTDPRLVPEAPVIPLITYNEMLEMSSLGSRVIQVRAVEFASKYNVPLRVLSSLDPGEGTLITSEKAVEEPIVSALAFDQHQAQLTIKGMPNKPGCVARVLRCISDAAIDVGMILQNAPSDKLVDFSFTVHREDFKEALLITRQVAKELGALEVVSDNTVAKLSLVGVGIRSHAGVAATLFSALSSQLIDIIMISTSEIKVSVVIHEADLPQAVKLLHKTFELEEKDKKIAINS